MSYGNNYENDNNSSMGGGDIVSLAVHPDLSKWPSATRRDEEISAQLAQSPQLQMIRDSSLKRKCLYCNESVLGIDDPERNVSHMRAHLQACSKYREATDKREKSAKAVSLIDSAAKEVDTLAAQYREAYNGLLECVYSILDVNTTRGKDLPCLSSEEYNRKYDNGIKNTFKVAAVYGAGAGSRANTERVARHYILDKEQKILYLPEHITRICDDKLHEIRSKHADLWDRIIIDLAYADIVNRHDDDDDEEPETQAE
jgi:hypothetical protein